jgi:hypothetical protein
VPVENTRELSRRGAVVCGNTPAVQFGPLMIDTLEFLRRKAVEIEAHAALAGFAKS